MNTEPGVFYERGLREDVLRSLDREELATALEELLRDGRSHLDREVLFETGMDVGRRHGAGLDRAVHVAVEVRPGAEVLEGLACFLAGYWTTSLAVAPAPMEALIGALRDGTVRPGGPDSFALGSVVLALYKVTRRDDPGSRDLRAAALEALREHRDVLLEDPRLRGVAEAIGGLARPR